jgi:hypothetical protein
MLALPFEIASRKNVDLIEQKVDGSRLSFDGKNLISNRYVNRNERYEHVLNELKTIDWKIRGEIAIPNGNILQLNKKENWHKAHFYIFDLYEYSGEKIDQHSPKAVRKLIDKILNENNFQYITAPEKFSSFDEGWEFIKKNDLEGLVLKDFDGILWKIKAYKEEKLPIVGYENGKAKGAFLINREGVISKISGTAIHYVEAYHELLNMGKTPYVEIEYLLLSDNGIPFQPKLRRLSTLNNLIHNID